MTDGSVNFILYVTWKEEDEKERLKQVKDFQETNVGDNTEALEEFFLGMAVDEVCAYLFLFFSFKCIFPKQELLINSQ